MPYMHTQKKHIEKAARDAVLEMGVGTYGTGVVSIHAQVSHVVSFLQA